jgi:hypothetical protein
MGALPGAALFRVAFKRAAIIKVLNIKRKSSSTAVGFVDNALALSKDLWATRQGCPSGPAKSTALEACGYVGNPLGLSKPCGKPVRVFHRAAYPSACL